MKKTIFSIYVLTILFLLLYPGREIQAQYDIDQITLTVGEACKLPDGYYTGMVIGINSIIKGDNIIGVSPGNSMAFLIGNESLKMVKVQVLPSEILVSMLDIGQGDSFLIRVYGKSILIDTGEKSNYSNLKSQLRNFGVNKLDTLIISHMDTDHMGSAEQVLVDYEADTLLIPSTPGNSNEYYKLCNNLEDIDTNVIFVKEDETYNLGAGCRMEILSVDRGEDTNDSSIIIKLIYKNSSFLFTGDASATVLNEIMDEGKDITADVLKVSHHGSDYSNPLLFLKKTGAEYALISVGKDNMYGHPTDNVIRRLETLGMTILRTDKDGTVTIRGDGKNLSVSCNHIVDWGNKNRLLNDNDSIIGNKKSMVYHKPTCRSLPAEHNRIYFGSEGEAEEAGYRPCGNCCKQKK